LNKLIPLGSRVIIRRDETLKKTAGGLYIPDGATQVPRRGVVLAVGFGISRRPGVTLGQSGDQWLKEGDVVLFNAFAGSDVPPGENADGRLTIMGEDDVLAIVVPEETKGDVFAEAAEKVTKGRRTKQL
jgi:chaperonin GroES